MQKHRVKGFTIVLSSLPVVTYVGFFYTRREAEHAAKKEKWIWEYNVRAVTLERLVRS
jgi:hypothetical protein